MNLKSVVGTILIPLLCILSSCTSSGSKQQASSPSRQAVGTAADGGSAVAPASAKPTYSIPKDAQVTIFCARIMGTAHVERATRMRDELIKSTGMKDWYVIIENEQTLLYYGFYRSVEDSRAQADRKKIDAMVDAMGNRPFRHALLVELTAPDPAAPPEWNLVNAKGAYTLQIAVYKGSPQRKQAAVDSVREARAKGIEAYYYHGDTASLVCIGTWPETAIKFSDTGSTTPDNRDPNQPLIYAPPSSDPELNQYFEAAARQANAKLIRREAQVVDPSLQQARALYPYNSVNGTLIQHMVNGKAEYDPSIPLDIRGLLAKGAAQNQANVARQGNPQQPAYDPTYRPPIPSQTGTPPTPSAQQPPQPGSGRLRSIGD